MTAVAIKLKEDFYRQIKKSPQSDNAFLASSSLLTEEEINSLAVVWVELILWKQAQHL